MIIRRNYNIYISYGGLYGSFSINTTKNHAYIAQSYNFK